jgi:serine/threonine protein kinase
MNRPLSSSKLGDFEIVRPLGEGGFGDVFEARARDTRLRVALKIIRDPLKRQAGEFLKEALFCNVVRERSPFVPQVVAAGVDEQTQRPWIAVEYIEGVTLEALMRGVRRKGMPWAWSEAREILYCVVHALRCAHEVHLVHCDIKPSNVMVARSSTPERRWIAYVLDFGVARLRSDLSKHATATAACSPAWASPEQLEARGVTPKSDQWSFALLVFWTLVGETFPLTERQRRSAVQWAQWHGVSLPPAFDAWFARATQASPDHRFADIDRAWEALEQIFARNIPAQQPVPSAVPAPSAVPWPSQQSSTQPGSSTGTVAALSVRASAPTSRRSSKRRRLALLALLTLSIALGIASLDADRDDRRTYVRAVPPTPVTTIRTPAPIPSIPRGYSPIANRPEILAAATRWRDFIHSYAATPVEQVYLPFARIRTVRRDMARADIVSWWSDWRLTDSSLTADLSTAVIRERAVSSDPLVDAPPCRVSASLVEMRVRVREYKPQLTEQQLRQMPCRDLRGDYTVRFVRSLDQWLVCHENWRREDYFAACPEDPRGQQR